MITVENVSKSFPAIGGSVSALREVNLEIGSGSVYGVVGPAASGKSTLARCISLQERPDRGTVRLDGLDTTGADGRKLRDLRRRVGGVSAKTDLLGERTAAGNVALPLEQLGLAAPQRRDRVGSLLDLVGLTRGAARRPSELSEGQRRRIAVARALATGAPVLLADDPTAGIDESEVGGVLHSLDRARAELGVTVLLATPDAGVARRVCDDIAVLDKGEVVESGSLLSLLTDPASRTADALLPQIEENGPQVGHYDRSADVVLVGFAAIGALLPEAGNRFGVDIQTVGGGVTRVGDTPVARFRLGLRGAQSDGALAWIGERGAHVTHAVRGVQGLAA